MMKVFLVEDNADTRYLLTHLLSDAGYAVQSASTVQEALREFPSSGSDVLVSDVGLPDGSGRDLVRGLRAAGEHPYAIAMSGYGTTSDIRASLEAGFRHHLVKPVEVEVLERLLESAQAEGEAASGGGH